MVFMHRPDRRRAAIAVLLLVLAAGWLIGLSRYSPPADELLIHRGYLVDASRTLAVDDVRVRAFRAFDGPLSRGNQKEHLWLSLAVPPVASSGWVLVFEPAYLRDIVVYQSVGGNRWQVSQGGTRLPFEARTLSWLNYSVPVITHVNHESVVYVRVASPSAFLSVRMMRADHAQYEDGLINFTAGISMGVVLVLMLLALSLWLTTRDDAWLYQLILNLSALVLFYFLLGLASKYLLPASAGVVDRAIVFFSCFLQFCVSLTFPRVLRMFSLPAWTMAAYRAGLLLFPMLCLAMWLDRDDIAWRGNHVLILLQALWALSIVCFARHADGWLLWIMRLMLALHVLHSVLWVWPIVMGGDRLGVLQDYPAVSGNLFVLAMMTAMLLRKTRLDVRQHQEQRLQSRLAEQRLLQEQQRHEETSAFLGLMMHELKNPLHSVRIMTHNMLTESATWRDSHRLEQIRGAVDAMERVLNLSIEVDIAEQGALTLQPDRLDMVDMIHTEVAARSPRIQIGSMPDSVWVRADLTILSMMLTNLIDNALKYSREGSVILVSLHAEPRHAVISICNVIGKSGLPDPDRVFEKYYRTPGAIPFSGMGLGLYWIRLVSRLMGGAVSCEIDGDHITFHLRVPR